LRGQEERWRGQDERWRGQEERWRGRNRERDITGKNIEEIEKQDKIRQAEFGLNPSRCRLKLN
jgi:hypothetical protein